MKPVTEYSLSELVCGVQTVNLDNLIFKTKKHCFNISKSFSMALIRVASTRIFNNPYQSILELPVNSIDAYRKKRNTNVPAVGKFGMGFFSMLHWILNPNYSIVLTSRTQNDHFQITMYSKNDEILLDYDPNIKRATIGTTITLNCDFEIKEAEKFYFQLEKLFDIPDVIIHVTGNVWEGAINDQAISTDIVEIEFTRIELNKINKITISDQAIGISKEILFNSLLVPSISTKGITTTKVRGFKDNSGFEKRLPHNYGFMITVNNVGVYTDFTIPEEVNENLLGYYVLTFPPHTTLAVSRDDIILHNKADENELYHKILNCAESVIEQLGDLTLFFYYLEMYERNTSQDRVKKSIYRAKKTIHTWKELYVFENSIYRHLKLSKPVVIPYPNPVRVYQYLIKHYPGRTDIFQEKRVIFINDITIDQITNGNLANYLFVPKAFEQLSTTLWVPKVVASYTQERLLLVEPDVKNLENILSEVKKEAQNKNMRHQKLVLNTNDKITKYFVSKIVAGLGTHVKESEYLWYVNKLKPLAAVLYNIFSNLDYQEDKEEDYQYYPGREEKENDQVNLIKDVVNNLLSANRYNDKQDQLSRFELLCELMYGKIAQTQLKFSYGESMYLRKLKKCTPVESKKRYKLIQRITGASLSPSPINLPGPSLPSMYLVSRKLSDLIFEFNVWGVQHIQKLNTIFTFDVVIFHKIDLDYDLIITEIEQYITHPVAKIILLRNLTYYLESTPIDQIVPRLNVIARELNNRLNLEYILSSYKHAKLDLINDIVTNLFDIMIKNTKMIGYMSLVKIKDTTTRYTFTGKSLINLIFTTNINKHDYRKWMRLAEKTSEDVNMQVLEIAINEGTTKDFIPAVFTELLQNSIDAIKSSGGDHHIDVKVSEKSLSFYDTVGIPDQGLLALLVPFLSSKSKEDMLATGEMGTGFFNVYRPEYTKRVLIETNNGDRSIRIEVHPYLERGRVMDLNYDVRIGQPIQELGTQITIFFNENVNKDDLLFQVSIQKHVLSLVSYPIFLNNEKINIQTTQVYEDDFGVVYYSNEVMFQSYVFTNNVPFRQADYLFDQYFDERYHDFLFTGFIFDFKKTAFIPSQARTKIAFKNENEISSFLNNGLYNAIIQFIFKSKNRFYGDAKERDFITTHFSSFHSSASMFQLTPSSVVETIIMSTFYLYQIPKTKVSIGSVISLINKRLYQENTITEERILFLLEKFKLPADVYNIIKDWFVSKLYMTQRAIETKLKSELVYVQEHQLKDDERSVYDFMQSFVDAFWSIGMMLEQTKRLQLTFFHKHSTSPLVQYATELDAAGLYNRSKHTITLKRDVLTKYAKDVSKLLSSETPEILILDLSIKEQINTKIGGTLSHELCHAWENTEHSTALHDDVEFILDQKIHKLPFNTAAAKMTAVILANGLFDEIEE